MDQLILQVKETISQLYNPNLDSNVKRQANQMLEEFQRNQDAWMVANALLTDQGGANSVLFNVFGATIIKTKCIHDQYQLNEESKVSLKNSILQLLLMPQSSGGQQKVIQRHLIVALIHLAVRLYDWTDAFNEICSQFNQSGKPVLMLDFVRLLPEEVSMTAASLAVKDDESDRHSQSIRRLLSFQNASVVLDLTMTILQQSSSDVDMVELGVQTLLSWFKTQAIAVQSIGLDKSKQLLSLLFSTLARFIKSGDGDCGQVCEVIADLLLEISARTAREDLFDNSNNNNNDNPNNSSGHAFQYNEFRLCIINHLWQLCEMVFGGGLQISNEIHRDLTRLITQIGEDFMPFIVKQTGDYGRLPLMVLECVKYQHQDPDEDRDLRVIGITFGFWFELTRVILDSDRNVNNFGQQGGSGGISQFHQSFIDLHLQLISAMMKCFQYPSSGDKAQNGDGMTAEEKEEFRDFRHAGGDVIKDCVMIVSPSEALKIPFQALNQFVTGLQQQQSQNACQWQYAEAAVFALRTMAAQVGDEQQILPQIIKMVPHLTEAVEKALPNSLGARKLRYVSILMLGRYAYWTNSHPEYVKEHLNFIYGGFKIGGQDLCSASALALKYLCESCSKHMIPFLNDLHQLYSSATSSGTALPRTEIMELTEAIAYIVNSAPLTSQQSGGVDIDLTKILQSFCQPIGEQLYSLCFVLVAGQQQQQSVGNASFSQVDILLERLGIFFRRVNPKVPVDQPHPCIQLFESCLPIFQQLMTYKQIPNDTMESVCKLIKRVLVSYEEYPQLNAIVNQTLCSLLAQSFQLTQHPALLWVASHIVRRFVHKYGTTASVNQMVESMLQQCFLLLNSVDKFNQSPELVDDFMRLLTACTVQLSQTFYSEVVLTPVVDFIIFGLNTTQVSALESLLDFANRLVSESMVASQINANSIHQNGVNGASNSKQMVLCNVMMTRLSPLLMTLISGIIGQNQSGNAYSGHLLQDLASLMMYTADLVSPQAFVSILQQTLQQIQAVEGNQVKLTNAIVKRVLDSYALAKEKGQESPLRYGLASLGAAFRVRSSAPAFS
ncbi:hypothetical protein MIR68_005452 [Amoeboaphelidium protococcarum]|nr:hypothetical protein MIR68_005452 [Amoeboaphelidium protococcarum]